MKPVVVQKAPYKVTLEAGKNYAWCSCGLSQTQPFCDGAHSGSGLAPEVFKAEASGDVWLCGCKASKKGALCDGTHKDL